MAIGSLLMALRRLHAAPLDAAVVVQQQLLQATAKEEQYRVDAFRQALSELRAALPPVRAAEAMRR